MRTRSNKDPSLGRNITTSPTINASLELMLVPETRRHVDIHWGDHLQLNSLPLTAQSTRLELVLSAEVDHQNGERCV
jgi:hypothetical protein